jgi:hypothetical protein
MSPGEPLQKSLYGTLTGSQDIASAMGGAARAYDRVPTAPIFPYLSFSDAQILDDGNTCDDDMFEVFVDIHVWSRAVGQVEAKRIADAVRTAVKDGFPVPGWVMSSVTVQGIRHFMDADGLTAHGIVTLRFLLQTA